MAGQGARPWCCIAAGAVPAAPPSLIIAHHRLPLLAFAPRLRSSLRTAAFTALYRAAACATRRQDLAYHNVNS